MPLVIVRRDPEVVSDQIVRQLAGVLPRVVANALDCPEGVLHSGHVEVYVEDGCGEFDQNVRDLEIFIEAIDYHSRRVDLDDRRKQIVAAVRTLVPSRIHGFVWVRLAPGSYGEF